MNGFLFFGSYLEAAERLPKERQLPFLKAVINFGLTGETPQLQNEVERMAFSLIKNSISSSLSKYQKRVNRVKTTADKVTKSVSGSVIGEKAQKPHNKAILTDDTDDTAVSGTVSGEMSAVELSKKLGVSIRTAYRYKAKNQGFDTPQNRDKNGRFLTKTTADNDSHRVSGTNPHNKAICTADNDTSLIIRNRNRNKEIESISPYGENTLSTSCYRRSDSSSVADAPLEGGAPHGRKGGNGDNLLDLTFEDARKLLRDLGAIDVGGDMWVIKENVYSLSYLMSNYARTGHFITGDEPPFNGY